MSSFHYREMFFIGGSYGCSWPLIELCWVWDHRFVDPNPIFKSYIVLPHEPDWVEQCLTS